jgi:hypothetical protein
MFFEARHRNIAGLVGNKTAAHSRDRRAFGCTDREY